MYLHFIKFCFELKKKGTIKQNNIILVGFKTRKSYFSCEEEAELFNQNEYISFKRFKKQG